MHMVWFEGPGGVPRRGGSERGVGLIELIIAMGVLVVALLALMSSITAGDILRETTREQSLAYNAARRKIEEIRNFAPFQGAFLMHSQGNGPGPTFTVPGLNAVPGNPVGRISFPVSGGALCEVGSGTFLRTAGNADIDLNGDGDAVDASVIADYKLLPVRVEILWKSVKGGLPTRLEVVSLIAEK